MADRTRPRASSTRALTQLHEVASSFVGRGADLAALRERFASGARLVTVLGAGGMGKTRLAIRFARECEPDYLALEGGVFFCDLTETRTEAGLVAVVAAALGVRLPKGGDAIAKVARTLAARGRVLLVLDNAEHVAAVGSDALASWLAAAPRCDALVTSRVAFDLPEETTWLLGPLARDEAIELFLGRARQVRPDLSDVEANRAAIAEIVAALDGMPLAIELAASRMAALSVAELRARLDRSLDLLSGRRDGGRHASVRRTVLDSVAELAQAERAAFVSCAVFRDGFTIDAAEAVIGAGALAAIEQLVRCSLLRATASAEGALRFSFFETIREVALEQLVDSPAQAAQTAARHDAFYAALAERWGAEAAVGKAAALLLLGRELENLLAAHAHASEAASEREAPRRALAIALGLAPMLSARGLSHLSLRLLQRAIDCARHAAEPDRSLLAEALVARGVAARETGDFTAARADLETGLAEAEALEKPGLVALAHARIGELIEVTGKTHDAHVRFARAIELLNAAPAGKLRTLHEAETYLRLAHLHRREGGLACAEAAVAEAVGRYRQLSHDEGLAAALYEAAVVAMFQGRRDVALSRFDEGLAVAERSGARAIAGALTTARGGLLQEMGDLNGALAHHAEAVRVFRELGLRYREMSASYYLATAYLERGDASEATRLLDRAGGHAQSLGLPPHYDTLIEGCRAIARAAQGDASAAREALARAELALSACASEAALGATIAIHRLTLAAHAGDAARESAEASANALAEAHPSDDSRFALRALLSVLHPTPPRPRAALRVWSEGRAFLAPGAAAPVDLARRVALRRVLALLAERRRAAPGEPVSLDELVAAGWPGERIDPISAANRAHVTLATLRKLGLRSLLFRSEGGYWLDPTVPVESRDEPQV